jgi:hypothetical protein
MFLIMILAAAALSANVFYRPDVQNGCVAPKDSVFLANPVQDRIMLFNEKKDIIVSDVFSRFPDNVNWFPVSERPLIVVPNLEQNDQLDIVLKLQANEMEGESDVSFTFYFYTDSTAADSVAMTDTFNVRVFDSASEWLSGGTTYGFEPQNCVGSMTAEWKSAAVFDLGNKTYAPKALEFGYLYDGKVKCEIVPFGTVPEDSVLIMISDSLTVEGGVAQFNYEGLSDELTGKIAVVFTTELNFMPMDPAGDSDSAWIWSEWTGWTRPELVSPDYQGAWYIKLLAKDTTTGIEEIFSTVRSNALISNYPNPFNNQTVISWDLPENAYVEADIYNSAGQFVKNLYAGSGQKGVNKAVFYADGLETGIYFTRIKINGRHHSQNKMLYLK